MTLSNTLLRYKYHLLAIALLMTAIYYPVIHRMTLQWYHDENYSHGFLVPLIAGYFVYERRESLKSCPVSPWNPGLLVVFLGLCQLITGYLATEYFTMRTSMIVLLAGILLYLFGKAVFRQLLLPVGYLMLMVPLPYILYNMIAFPLKLFVTRISVGFLQLIGVVVLREGNIIIFPTTTLEVADACSGMRSLISLLAIGIAFAFYIRSTPLKRFLLIISAIPVAVFTNALRVIVTGVLAQYWGAQVAEGFFHEFAGLMVFALAMLILGGIGILLRGEESEAVLTNTPFSQLIIPLNHRFAVVGILLILAGSYKLLHVDLLVPPNRPFNSFPVTVNDWQMASQDTFSQQILNVLKPTDYISRTYTNKSGTTVQLYIGYHGGGSESGELHSPRNCLPGSGWQEISSLRTRIDSEQGRINLVKATYKQRDRTEQFYYWFQVQNQTISNEYALKLAQIINSLLHRRREASFIRITVPVLPGGNRSPIQGEQFIKDFYPVIREFLPR